MGKKSPTERRETVEKVFNLNNENNQMENEQIMTQICK